MTTANNQAICIVTGGSGYIGGFLIRRLLAEAPFRTIYNFDLVERDFGDPRVVYRKVDLRLPISVELGPFDASSSWIFNLAALCREPGSEPHEYFDTNVGGAETVTEFARKTGIPNLFFTSTMSSYGRMLLPTPETAPQYPETPYGISKAIAERIHRTWLAGDPSRRLVILRPSVIFGPNDKENIPRMLRAVRKGYFLFPGSPDIVKGYGYIYGLIDSIRFVMDRRDGPLIIYNYAERDCVSIGGMVNIMQKFYGKRTLTMRIPSGLLLLAAYAFQALGKVNGKRYAIHPVRVRKVAFPTNLKPDYLIRAGFPFKYPLEKALEHWKSEAPGEI